MAKNKSAVNLANLRWKGKSKKARQEHIKMMLAKRYKKPKKVIPSSPLQNTTTASTIEE